jgi:hypothetical protein
VPERDTAVLRHSVAPANALKTNEARAGIDLALAHVVVWFFERQSEKLRYEIRREFDGDAFEVLITASAGKTVERHQSGSDLLQCIEGFWSGLLEAGWRPTSPDEAEPEA